MLVDIGTQLAVNNTCPTTRRQFLKIALGAVAGFTVMLGPESLPAIHGQSREITLLSPKHFVAASNGKLRELVQRFSKDSKNSVTIKHIANP